MDGGRMGGWRAQHVFLRTCRGTDFPGLTNLGVITLLGLEQQLSDAGAAAVATS